MVYNSKVLKKISLAEKPQLFFILLLGFSSGLPFLLTLSTLSYWLTEAGISKTAIGLFMLISLPYSLKFLWAPLMDYFSIPILSKIWGQRRSWAFVMQIGLFISLIFLGQTNPAESLQRTAFFAFCVSFFAASQDIIIDAYRIEIIAEKNRGIAAALESIGFRFGMLASGAGALYLADVFDWSTAYMVMAAFVVIGMITVLIMPEPEHPTIINLHFPSTSLSKTMSTIFWRPLQQFKTQKGFATLLLFIFCFKMADTVLNAMSAPFLCDLGYSKIEFAQISKIFGISLMVIGGLFGGFAIKRLGAIQSIVLCAVLQGSSCLMFVIQSLVGYNLMVLTIIVGFESFCSGLTSAVFIAYLSGFCCQPHTATHFTLLYSFGSLSRVITSALAGWIADHWGWAILFFVSSLMTFPCLFLIGRLHQSPKKEENSLKINRRASG